MSLFSDSLRSAMAAMGWTQDDFVRRTGAVSRGSVSRYLSGIDVPKPATLDQICTHLPPNLVQEVTAAYLTDQIPRAAAKHVSVSVVKEGNQPPTVYHADQPLPGSHLERILRTLGKEAINNVNLFHILDALAAGYENRQPLLMQTPGEITVRTVEERARSLAEAEQEIVEQERRTQSKTPPRPRVQYDRKVRRPESK